MQLECDSVTMRRQVIATGASPMLLDLYFATVFFTLPLEGTEPNAVKGFGVETMGYGKRLPPTVGVRLSHEVTVGISHGREPVEQVSTCRFQS